MFHACGTKSFESVAKIHLALERRVVFSEINDPQSVPYDYANAIELGSSESIFLRDARTGVILKIGTDGKLLKIIGRQGQGPGEFQSRSGPYYVDSQDNLYVLDQTRIVKFDIDGNYIRDLRAAWSIEAFIVGSGGVVICAMSDINENNPKRVLRRITEASAENLLAFPDESTIKNSGVSLSLRAPDSGTIMLRPFPDQSFCLADNRNFVVYFFSQEAALTGQLKIKREKIPLTAEETAKMRRAMEYMTRGTPGSNREIPKYKVFFHQLIVDEDERLYFLRKESQNRFEMEIYSRKGLLLGRTELPFLPLAVRNLTFYSLDAGPDGELLGLSSWKIKNPEVLNVLR